MNKNKFNYFLSSIVQFSGYEINDEFGRNNRILNIIDFVLLLIYFFITECNLWINGFGNIPYWIIIILSFRTICKKAKQFWYQKKQNQLYAPAYLTPIIVYLIIIVLYVILYFPIKTYCPVYVLNILATFYYITYFSYETIMVLVDCFDAEPYTYKLEKKEETDHEQ